MNAHVNTYALRQTGARSASLGVLGVIVHPLTGGEYAGAVYRDDRVVGKFSLTAAGQNGPNQVDLDVAALVTAGQMGGQRAFFSLVERGHIVLYVSWGRGGYHVRLARSDLPQERTGDAFDSRQLQAGDLFVVRLLRPGLYEARDAQEVVIGKIRVEYPMTSERRESVEPVLWTLREDTVDPPNLAVRCGQPVVFSIQSPGSAVSVHLLEPNEGPRKENERARTRVIRGRNPG